MDEMSCSKSAPLIGLFVPGSRPNSCRMVSSNVCVRPPGANTVWSSDAASNGAPTSGDVSASLPGLVFPLAMPVAALLPVCIFAIASDKVRASSAGTPASSKPCSIWVRESLLPHRPWNDSHAAPTDPYVDSSCWRTRFVTADADSTPPLLRGVAVCSWHGLRRGTACKAAWCALSGVSDSPALFCWLSPRSSPGCPCSC